MQGINNRRLSKRTVAWNWRRGHRQKSKKQQDESKTTQNFSQGQQHHDQQRLLPTSSTYDFHYPPFSNFTRSEDASTSSE